MSLDNEGAPSNDVAAEAFHTVFSDVLMFIAALFILFFTLSYNDNTGSSVFDDVSLEIANESNKDTSKQSQSIKAQESNMLLNDVLSQFAVVDYQIQQVRVKLNDPVLFKKNKYALEKKHKQILRHFSNLMEDVPNVIIIQGQTSPSESIEAMDLSIKRSKNVYDFLVSEGKIEKERLLIQPIGLSKQSTVPHAMQQKVVFSIVRSLRSK